VTPGDPLLELGLTAPSVYALRASQYLAATGASPADLASVTVKSRIHAARNPYVTFNQPVTVEEVLGSPMIADPLTRLQCCPVSDGAAAVVIGRAGAGRPLAELVGWALRSGMSLDRADAADRITSRTAAAAYEMASVAPSDIDLCEVHDAFTIGELQAIEGLGICPPGEAAAYTAAGRATLGGGGTVVNPSGGLLARGHPPGATGLAQVFEATMQLAGRAGGRQVEGARMAVCHTRGGGSFDLDANACGVLVMRGGR
jgi:acetyl-CoA acetyltransferase